MSEIFSGFASRLTKATRRFGPLCVGLDPYPDKIPRIFGPPGAAAAEAFCLAVIGLAAHRIAAVKPQMALFEIWGAAGIKALERVCAAAKQAGLLIILDGKRGDIGATGGYYAKAYLGPDPALEADCLTISPYMGLDSIAPFAEAASATGKGVAVLVRTSNPGAIALQNQHVNSRPLYLHIAAMLAPIAAQLTRTESDWSSMMAVVGATAPEEALEIRNLLPNTPFLVPGFGAQGASAKSALSGFRRDGDGWQGGLVNSARAILFPTGTDRDTKEGPWETAVSAAIFAAQKELNSLDC